MVSILSIDLFLLSTSLLIASFLWKRYESFLLEDASNLTYEFLYDTFNFQENLFKIVIENSCVKFDAFLRRDGIFIFKNKALRSESVKVLYLFNIILFILG